MLVTPSLKIVTNTNERARSSDYFRVITKFWLKSTMSVFYDNPGKSQNRVLFRQGAVKRGKRIDLQYLSAHIILHQDLWKLVCQRGNETRQDGWFCIARLPEYWLYIPDSARANSIINRTVSNSTDSYVCRPNSRLMLCANLLFPFYSLRNAGYG